MGLRSASPISRALMDYWDKNILEIKEKSQLLHLINPIVFEKLVLHLLAKYVDDVLTMAEKMRRGVRWSNEHQMFT